MFGFFAIRNWKKWWLTPWDFYTADLDDIGRCWVPSPFWFVTDLDYIDQRITLFCFQSFCCCYSFASTKLLMSFLIPRLGFKWKLGHYDKSVRCNYSKISGDKVDLIRSQLSSNNIYYINLNLWMWCCLSTLPFTCLESFQLPLLKLWSWSWNCVSLLADVMYDLHSCIVTLEPSDNQLLLLAFLFQWADVQPIIFKNAFHLRSYFRHWLSS